jgi:hypothetical protein
MNGESYFKNKTNKKMDKMLKIFLIKIPIPVFPGIWNLTPCHLPLPGERGIKSLPLGGGI